ncbi:MAG: DUF6788 family protein [Bryobacteraceae bacterium]
MSYSDARRSRSRTSRQAHPQPRILREMLPGSFVERKRACGRPNCHCADGNNLHSQYQISVLVDGQPKAFNIPAELVEEVRQKIEMRRRFDAAAATVCGIHLRRFLKHKEPP